MSDSTSEYDHLIPDNHADNFANDKDHDNISDILDEMRASGASEKSVRDFLNGARVDLTDAELLSHLREYRGEPKLRGNSIDENWKNFST